MALLLTCCFAFAAVAHLWSALLVGRRPGEVRRPLVDATFHAAMSVAMLVMVWFGDMALPTGLRVAQVLLFASGAAWFALTPRRERRWNDVVGMTAMVWMLLTMDGQHAHHGGVAATSTAGQVTFVLVGLLVIGSLGSLVHWAERDLGRDAGRRVPRWVAPRLATAVMGGAMALALAPSVAG